ncbi:MAG TPA: SAM-dependent methyltransferase [Trebonia sp.]|nr:SAM-dependent methyltransferase [Trebonia sp.]
MPEIDTSRAHPARMYDYLLGGKNHFEADRAAIRALQEAVPNARTGARENRAFLGRAVKYLATEAGVRQFLDIGSGLPTANNVHEVAQSVAPESRVVYVDNDPIVMAHARALLTSHPAGRTAYVQADLHDPGSILNHPSVRETLDFGEPVALMLVAVLHFFPDDEDPAGIVSSLIDALPPGSYLVASQTTTDFHDETKAADGIQAVQRAGVPFRSRTAAEFADLFLTGVKLVPPGLVPVSEWRPEQEPGLIPLPAEVGYLGAVARKP